jgi:hypothetical protein
MYQVTNRTTVCYINQETVQGYSVWFAVILKQDRSSTYNETLRCGHEAILAVENKINIINIINICVSVWVPVRVGVCMCVRVCNLTYPACYLQAPMLYWPLWFHHIFRHYLTKSTIFGGGGGKLLNIKCVFWFSIELLILRRIQRDIVMNVKKSSCKVSVILVRF